MFLKNNSEFQCGLRTKKEVLTIAPGEVVHILDEDIIRINSNLDIVDEATFNAAANSDEAEEINNDAIITEADTTTEEPVEDKTQEVTENVIEEASEAAAEDTIEELNENNTNIQTLEKELEELKTKWEAAPTAVKKSKIQKKIKEVQEKINKLQ